MIGMMLVFALGNTGTGRWLLVLFVKSICAPAGICAALVSSRYMRKLGE